jgi:hypothetical protein
MTTILIVVVLVLRTRDGTSVNITQVRVHAFLEFWAVNA